MSANSKPEAFAGLLASGHVRVNLDPRRPGVVLPPDRLTDKYLCLDYGRNLATPTTDVEVDGWGIRATLSFGRRLSTTFIPWSCVYAITNVDGVGSVYPDDLPDEIEWVPAQPPQTRTGGMSN